MVSLAQSVIHFFKPNSIVSCALHLNEPSCSFNAFISASFKLYSSATVVGQCQMSHSALVHWIQSASSSWSAQPQPTVYLVPSTPVS